MYISVINSGHKLLGNYLFLVTWYIHEIQRLTLVIPYNIVTYPLHILFDYGYINGYASVLSNATCLTQMF